MPYKYSVKRFYMSYKRRVINENDIYFNLSFFLFVKEFNFYFSLGFFEKVQCSLIQRVCTFHAIFVDMVWLIGFEIGDYNCEFICLNSSNYLHILIFYDGC